MTALERVGDGTTPETARSHVAILMAVFNGARFLQAQLDSLEAQTHRDWSLHVSDDGSSDDSLALIRDFAERTGRAVTIRQGPSQGYARNFLSLLDATPAEADFVAFCDQDDVWLPEKLSRALDALSQQPADRPALYGTRFWIWFAETGTRRLSQPRPRPTVFRNALAQNFAGGNTMVFNRAALAVAIRTRSAAAGVVSHDWWLYQIVTGVGGVAIHDPEPTILYRQHRSNQIGANDGTRARMVRLRQVLAGRYAQWNASNIAALRAVERDLTDDNRAVLALFEGLRRRGPLGRLSGLHRSGVYRQSLHGTIALWIAAILRRL